MEYVPKHSQRISNYGHMFSLEAVYALKAKCYFMLPPLSTGMRLFDFKTRMGNYFLILLMTGINGY